MRGKDSVNKVGQLAELAQQQLKNVRNAVLDDREIEMTDQVRAEVLGAGVRLARAT